jgi:hypothetical protein
MGYPNKYYGEVWFFEVALGTVVSTPLNHHRLRSTTIDSAQPPGNSAQPPSTPLNHLFGESFNTDSL